ncbi:MAG: long-chain N-acyl amino acid synthase [Planctomycetes bacterium]|nr:long-chain N-acyl amino acid synthase [Planctomycetota bacterium]
MSVLLLPEAPVKRCGDQIQYCMAQTPGDRTGAFQLVYRSYMRAGLGSENPYGMRVTRFQLEPASQIFVGKICDEVVSTVTLVPDGPLGLPMDSMFREEVDALRNTGKRVSEVSCLADRRSSTSRFLDTFSQLTRLMAQYARYQRIDCLLVTVHPRHARFYKRYLGFLDISDRIESCPHAQDRPAAALKLDFEFVDRERPECWNDFFGEWLSREGLEPYTIGASERELLTAIAGSCEDAASEREAEPAMAGT